MTAPYPIGVDRFAAWARTRGVQLPDPIDITGVDAAGVEVPADDPHLERLAATCAAAQGTVFVVELLPAHDDRVAVAMAAGNTGAAVFVDGGSVTVTATRSDELVRTIGALVPELRGLPQPAVQLPEEVWNDLLRQVATDPSQRSVAAALHQRGIGDAMVEAMLTAKNEPVPIGLVGASARIDTSGPLLRGPTLASWFAYPAGAVLATLLAPRRGGARTVHVEPYSSAAVIRALSEALPAAHRAAERAAQHA